MDERLRFVARLLEGEKMAKSRKRKFWGIAPPVLVREPLLLRLCNTFVDNLTLLLRTGLVLGAVVLVHDLRILLEEVTQPVAENVPPPAAPIANETIVTPATLQHPVLSEGVMHALNCTYADYRNEHYDECVKDPSRIFQRPQADPDNTGHVTYDTPVLYARLDNQTRME